MNTNAKTAYGMHLAGNDEFEIAEHLRLPVADVRDMITNWSASLPSPSNAEARRDEIKRVDTWLARLDLAYHTTDEDGRREIPIDKAITSFVRLSERRCRLLGLDVPTRAEVEMTLNGAPPSSVDEEIQKLAVELGLNDK